MKKLQLTLRALSMSVALSALVAPTFAVEAASTQDTGLLGNNPSKLKMVEIWEKSNHHSSNSADNQDSITIRGFRDIHDLSDCITTSRIRAFFAVLAETETTETNALEKIETSGLNMALGAKWFLNGIQINAKEFLTGGLELLQANRVMEQNNKLLKSTIKSKETDLKSLYSNDADEYLKTPEEEYKKLEILESELKVLKNQMKQEEISILSDPKRSEQLKGSNVEHLISSYAKFNNSESSKFEEEKNSIVKIVDDIHQYGIECFKVGSKLYKVYKLLVQEGKLLEALKESQRSQEEQTEYPNLMQRKPVMKGLGKSRNRHPKRVR